MADSTMRAEADHIKSASLHTFASYGWKAELLVAFLLGTIASEMLIHFNFSQSSSSCNLEMQQRQTVPQISSHAIH